MKIISVLLCLVAPLSANGFAPSSSSLSNKAIGAKPNTSLSPVQIKSELHTCTSDTKNSIRYGNPSVLFSASASSTAQHASTQSNLFQPSLKNETKSMNSIKAAITKAGLMSYIVSMCIALPITLFPAAALYKTKLISKTTKEHVSLRVGQFCSRWLMRVFPFAKVNVIKDGGTTTANRTSKFRKLLPLSSSSIPEPEPTIWVCNHTSMLDIFMLLSVDKKLRGKKKRPIKIIYWKELEKNLVTKLLFTMCGFIPVEMDDNGNGSANSYKKSTFKKLLKDIKQAFEDGFDIGILPEGQLNPSPEKGLQPVFPGAFTLAKISRRPIRMMGLHGLHRLWHPDESIGMTVTGRKVTVRSYPEGIKFKSAEDFVECFENVIGYFGAQGKDLPNWMDWFSDKKYGDEVKNNSIDSNVEVSR